MPNSICSVAFVYPFFFRHNATGNALVNFKEISHLQISLCFPVCILQSDSVAFILLKVHNFELTESTVSLTVCHSAVYFIRDPQTQSSKQYWFSFAVFIFRGFSLPSSNVAFILSALKSLFQMCSSADCLHAVILKWHTRCTWCFVILGVCTGTQRQGIENISFT